MKIKLISITALVILFSCKKEYYCHCSNPYADIEGFIIKDTKINAKKKCKEVETNSQRSSLPLTCNITK